MTAALVITAILTLCIVGPKVARIYIFDAIERVMAEPEEPADEEVIALAVEWAAEDNANGAEVPDHSAYITLAAEALRIRTLPEHEPGQVSW